MIGRMSSRLLLGGDHKISPCIAASTCAASQHLAVMHAWEFQKGRELRVRVEGQLVFNGTANPPQRSLYSSTRCAIRAEESSETGYFA
jgi:hypothetical protein